MNSANGSSFLSAWFRTRPGALTRRASAVLILVAVIGVPAMLEAPKSSLAARYRQAGRNALKAGKSAAADLYYRRATQLEPGDTEGRYGMAVAAEKRDNLPLAFRLMSRLANETNYPLAHYWLAEKALDQQHPLSEEGFWEIRRHLEIAVNDPVLRVDSQELLGSVLLRHGEPFAAIPYLAAAAESRPELRLSLAQAQQSVGQMTEAQAQIELAVEHFRRLNIASPDDADSCLLRIRCENMAGQYATTARLLREAVSRFPEDERFKAEHARFQLDACDRAIVGRRYDLAMRFLQNILGADPQCDRAIERLGHLASVPNERQEEATAALNQLVLSGQDSAAVHLALGGMRLGSKQYDRAISHFEVGLQHEPKHVALLNNLAWSLLQIDPPDPKRALGLINRAIEGSRQQTQQHAEILETRGQILLALKRPAEAAADLEAALSNIRNPVSVRQQLAEIYDGLEQPEKAGAHRRAMDRLAQEPRQDARKPR